MGRSTLSRNISDAKFEVGLSAILNDAIFYILARSTMQFTVQNLSPIVAYSFFFSPLDFSYHSQSKNFKTRAKHFREHTNAFHLHRSLNNAELELFIKGLSNELSIFNYKAALETDVIFDANQVAMHQQLWSERNYQIVSEWLLQKMYIISFIPNCTHGIYWPDKSEIMDTTFQLAKQYHIFIDVNKVPDIFSGKKFLSINSEATSTPALIFAVKKNNYGLVKLLLKNGANVESYDDDKKSVLDYAKENSLIIKTAAKKFKESK